ncbi:hypothetical protein Taro_053732, partial [Colocasia esculenta]|nr:hypothetical protein [Colocasia esculenta]
MFECLTLGFSARVPKGVRLGPAGYMYPLVGRVVLWYVSSISAGVEARPCILWRSYGVTLHVLRRLVSVYDVVYECWLVVANPDAPCVMVSL